MILCKQKKDLNVSNVRKILVSINFLGSAGPLRFIVSEDVLVMQVIDTALKTYARVGRLPVLGSDINDFLLYCPSVGSDVTDFLGDSSPNRVVQKKRRFRLQGRSQ